MTHFGCQWILLVNIFVGLLGLQHTNAAADPNPSAGADPVRSTGNSPRFVSPLGMPRITEHPEDAFFARGQPETLNCKAEGNPTPTISWFKDGHPVETNQDNPISHRLLLGTGQLFFLRVVHSKNNQSDIGEYYCNATNIHGTTISRTAHIQIAVLKDDFREEPSDTTTAVGQTVTLHCKPPRGKPEPKVIWRKNDDPVQTDNRVLIQDDGDLVIKSVEKQDIGEYLCFATNKGGDKHSRPAQLQVLDVPIFNKLPKDLEVEEGDTAEFHCDVIGDGQIKVKWSKEGGSIRLSRARILKDNTLKFEKVELADKGVYVCTADNAAGSKRATARLIVYSSPSFLIRPKDQVVAKGRTVTLQCVAQGNPPPTVFWSKDSKASPHLIFPNGDPGQYTVAEDGTLRIQSANMSDAGVYICEALNLQGQARASATVKVIDHDPRPPPIIRIGPQNQTLPMDSVALLRCQAEGTPKPVIRWYRNGRPLILSDARLTLLASGTLQISDLRVQDTGTYTCKAVSETGETTWQSFLAVSNDLTPIRSSAISSLPDPPTKPVVRDVTHTTVHLSWTPGSQNGQAPVFAYYVEYFGYETTDGWVVASRNVKRESYTVEKLKPNTSYLFLIRAVNANGVGYPSLVSNSVQMLAHRSGGAHGALSRKALEQKLGGEVVELINVQSINSSAISLAWRALKSEDIIEGFQIQFRHILNIRRLVYGKSDSLSVTAVVTSFTLTGLDSYSWYEVCVSAYSREVKSRCSQPVKVQTAELITAGAPENVLVKKNSSTEVSVMWSPADMRHAHYVTGYKIHCMSRDRMDNCSLSTNRHTYQVRIKQLHPDKEYVIRVAAITNRGQGAWSDTYILSGSGVQLAKDPGAATTVKPITDEEPEDDDLFKKPWFIILIVSVGIILWVALCIFSVWLCQKRKNKKKMKEQRYYTGVPMHKNSEPNRNMMYPPQYGVKDQNINFTNDLDLPPELRGLLTHGKKEQEMNEENIYRMAGDGNFPEMKTFYQKVDPVAPYATTALIQQQNLMKQRMGGQQQGLEHMFRPINQGYIQHSEGSADSCQKPAFSSDSNPDHSHCTTDHNHSDNMQSPTSDSASHTTDENGMLIKQKKKSKKEAPYKQNAVNWSELLPPPPEHPPPSECGDPPMYSEIRDDRQSSRSPLSPVSFSQLSACSCPNPHTQTPVSAWNMQLYSDNECPRCHSEKYYDPMAYCQEALLRRTQSPRAQTLQHVNITQNNIPNSCTCSPRATPVANMNCQYAQPQRTNYSNCVTPHGDLKSNLNRASHSSHSDNEAPSALPCFQSYKIVPKSEKDYRFLREKEWGPEPAPPFHNCGHDSGMGLEEDGSCMDRACQSSLPSLAPNECINNSLYRARPTMSSSAHVDYKRSCDSPSSEGGDYAAESDLDQAPEHPENWTEHRDGHTDCSSVHSSTCSSGDGTFLTEEDFASAVARAAEMSGLTVVGTTVCDLNNKAKKEKRHRRPARPISPGYSTDSNYGSIGVVHKPYPKSQRKKQMEQSKVKPALRSDLNDNMTRSGNAETVYDTIYGRTNFITNTSSPASPVVPIRVSSLAHMANAYGYQGLDRGGYSSFRHENVAVPLKEDIV